MEDDQHPVNLNKSTCHEALRAHSTSSDGRFFVAVSSTKIYCRPICRAKTPKEENCTFYPSAAAAEAAGYRPCRLCRPEAAPGLPRNAGPLDIALRAAAILEENCLADADFSELAASLGVSESELEEGFIARFGASPEQYLGTCRRLLAKRLLSDTVLSVAEIALHAGFHDEQEMDAAFKSHYRGAPESFRGRRRLTDDGTIALGLSYRPPYAWDELVEFLGGRTIPGVERMTEGAYMRTVSLERDGKSHSGWIRVSNDPKRSRLSLTLSGSLLPVLTKVLLRVRRLFDLDSDPTEMSDRLSCLDELAPGMYVPGLRVPGCFDPFEMSVRAVLGQQITVKAARTLATRIANTLGEAVDTPFEELMRTFPTSKMICDLERPIEDRLGPLGVTGARSRCILALAEALENGAIRLTTDADPQVEMAKLLKLPGFGPWTVNYVAMRAFSWPDGFPHTDYGVKKALTGLNEKEILERSQKWKPWRSYATMCLWNSLR